MAFNDTYRESIQTKHLSNVGFTSTAKGVTNEGYATKNPHQLLAAQIPTVDVVTTYGIHTASGISAGVVEEHIVKLTADPTVNNNKAWIAYETNCTTSGHSSRGAIRLGQWMRYPETEYKLRVYSDTGANAPDYTKEILPSEVQFNWEYDPSAGILYFDEDPTNGTGFTAPLWGTLYTYVGETVADSLASISGSGGPHDHDDRYYTETEIDGMLAGQDSFLELTDTISSYTDGRMLVETGTGLVDYTGLTYASGTSIFTAPNVAVTTDLTVGGDSTLTGALGFDTGTTINEFIVTLSGSPTDDQVATALGVKNYVDDQIGDTNTVSGLGVFKNISDGIDTTTASGTNDTLVFIGENGIGISVSDDPNTVTISGASQTSLVNTIMTWNAGEYWEYGSNFTSVPSDLIVYYNGVKQRNHTDYYVASIVSGVLRITFAFTTYSSDWVNIEYSLTTNTEGLARQWVIKIANYTAITGDRIILDSSAAGSNGIYTITLPANPVYGNHICFLDAGGHCGTNSVTVGRNGENIQGVALDMLIDSNDASFELVFFNTARGWVIYE